MPVPRCAGGLLGGLARAVLLGAALSAGSPVRADLDPAETAIRDAILQRPGPMLETLQDWVEINTGSWNAPGLERFGGILAEGLRGIGFGVEVRPGVSLDVPGRERARTGPLLLGRRTGPPSGPRILLIGHLDTVFEPDSAFQRFARDPDDPDRASGPGVVDMKGGLVVLFEALRALDEGGHLGRGTFTVLLDADEEIGSLGSRPVIEAEARRADFGLVFEAARPSGAMVRSRRGLGQVHLSVRGVAAHAGSAHEKGRSAVRDLAEKVVRIERLTDYTRGLTVNVGTFRGGTKRNVVPEHAECWIDLRYDDAPLGEEAQRAVGEIARETFVSGTRTEVWSVLHRPPMRETAASRALLERHARVAADLGVELPDPEHAGGGTDGSLTAGQGLPTLDTLGPVGGASHTDREFIRLSSLPERTAIAAILIHRLLGARDR